MRGKAAFSRKGTACKERIVQKRIVECPRIITYRMMQAGRKKGRESLLFFFSSAVFVH